MTSMTSSVERTDLDFKISVALVAGDQDRHKRSVEFDFGSNQTTHFRVTWP